MHDRNCPYCGGALETQVTTGDRWRYTCRAEDCEESEPFEVSRTEEAVADGFWTQDAVQQKRRLRNARIIAGPGDTLRIGGDA
jgi:hypothetical protein